MRIRVNRSRIVTLQGGGSPTSRGSMRKGEAGRFVTGAAGKQPQGLQKVHREWLSVWGAPPAVVGGGRAGSSAGRKDHSSGLPTSRPREGKRSKECGGRNSVNTTQLLG